jgi:Na+-transporting methylmalonyl-CoA/oxaloacetate decarboxylase gamma subunit
VLNATWFVLAGMAIVFGTLSLLILAMIALNRWLRPEPEAKARTTRAGHA